MREWIYDIDEANQEIDRLRRAVAFLGERLEEAKRDATRFMMERDELQMRLNNLFQAPLRAVQ